MYKHLSQLLFCLFLLIKAHPLSADLSISEQYLEQYPLDTIKESIGIGSFEEHYPVMKKMIAHEKESGFFGYHGCSQRYRIFQDILRAVFEEVLEYQIPADFQFLRIPGEEMFNLKNGKQSFYHLFDRKPPKESTKLKIIDVLFLAPFNESFPIALHTEDLSAQDKKEIWKIVLEFVATLDSLAMEDYYFYEFEETKHSRALQGHTAYMRSIRKLMENILASSEEQNLLAPRLVVNKSIEQLHTIYMRLLKKKSKKVNSKQVKAIIANHFKFRPMLLSLYLLSDFGSENSFWNFFFPYNDHIPGQQARIVCLNMPLFGNHYRLGECSLYVFLSGSSIALGDNAIMLLLSSYFDKIGLDENLPVMLQDMAIEELNRSGKTNGSMMQFFDLSEKQGKAPYQGADQTSYVSHSFGIPLKQFETSDFILGKQPIQKNGLDLQLRLIPCNQTTLNPYSFLRIVRYDSQDPATSKRIIKRMRKKLKTGIVDMDKLKKYKAKINLLWN